VIEELKQQVQRRDEKISELKQSISNLDRKRANINLDLLRADSPMDVANQLFQNLDSTKK